MHELFNRWSRVVSGWMGSQWAFVVALAVILVWVITGPMFHYSDTWQLVINTGTTVVTFLMVFLIQNTQNRDNDVLHIKLDELLRSTKAAHNALMNLDQLDNSQLKQLLKEYREIGEDRATDLPADETGGRRGDAQ